MYPVIAPYVTLMGKIHAPSTIRIIEVLSASLVQKERILRKKTEEHRFQVNTLGFISGSEEKLSHFSSGPTLGKLSDLFQKWQE